MSATGARTVEVVYAICSLPFEQARPAMIATWLRQHWGIENRVHWVRDVTFDEDRCTVRTGAGPQVLATVRNSAVNLHRLGGANNIVRGMPGHRVLHATAASPSSLTTERPGHKRASQQRRSPGTLPTPAASDTRSASTHTSGAWPIHSRDRSTSATEQSRVITGRVRTGSAALAQELTLRPYGRVR